MKQRILAIAAALLFAGTGLFAQSISLVDTDLAERMEALFPELAEGYIDLNANGSLDRFQDMDELVPESLIQDRTLQVQEVLDFILANFRFFTVERLEEVRDALETAEGDIPEIIAISYRDRLAGAIEDKREFGADELYLPPSVLARAQEEMSGYISSMVHSFRKEEGEFAAQFAQAREQLFSMMEAGYPLPDMSSADASLLAASMIHTITTTGEDDPARVKAAIRTLGRLEAEQAIPQLQELLSSQEFRVAAAEALGDIGNNRSRNILSTALEESVPGAFQNALIRAVGRVGGTESAERIIRLAEETAPASGSGDGDKMLTVLRAMVDLIEQGNRNRDMYQTLSEHLEHPDPAYRRVAAEGIAAYGGRNALGLLQPRLQEEQNEEVLVTLVRELRSYDEVSVLTGFTSLLGAPSTSARVKREVISAIGDHANGTRVVNSVMEFLSDSSEELRSAASETMAALYERDSRSVVGALSREVRTSENAVFLTEATRLLGELADPASLTALLEALGSPHEEVRKNASWGLYRIRPSDNVRVAQELQTLVNSEAEPIEVRINAVRALGAMRQNSARLEVDKTLTTTLRLRSPEYTMLRYFAVRALASLPELDEQAIAAMVETASANEPALVRSAALQSLRHAGGSLRERTGTIAGIAQRSDDISVKLAALELLGDIGAAEAVGVANSILGADPAQPALMQTAYALSRSESEDAVSLLINLAAEESVRELAMGFLRDSDPATLSRVVERRLETVEDPAVREVLEELQGSVAGR